MLEFSANVGKVHLGQEVLTQEFKRLWTWLPWRSNVKTQSKLIQYGTALLEQYPHLNIQNLQTTPTQVSLPDENQKQIIFQTELQKPLQHNSSSEYTVLSDIISLF